MTTTKPKRRFLRISIRTLLIVLTILCIWLGWTVEQVRKKRSAVSWVLASGGAVNYEHNYFNPYTEPAGPESLRKVLGDDFFADVFRIRITNPNVSDLTPLAGLTQLTLLQLSGTEVEDLTPLAHLKSLALLELSGTNVGDLTPLAGLGNLKTLDLSGTQVSDLMPLAGLTNLEVLHLGGTHVSEAAVERLRTALPQCNIEH